MGANSDNFMPYKTYHLAGRAHRMTLEHAQGHTNEQIQYEGLIPQHTRSGQKLIK